MNQRLNSADFALGFFCGGCHVLSRLLFLSGLIFRLTFCQLPTNRSRHCRHANDEEADQPRRTKCGAVHRMSFAGPKRAAIGTESWKRVWHGEAGRQLKLPLPLPRLTSRFHVSPALLRLVSDGPKPCAIKTCVSSGAFDGLIGQRDIQLACALSYGI